MAQGFEGTPDELEELLLDGLHSGEAAEADDAFWQQVAVRTDAMQAEYRKRGGRSPH